VKKLGAAKAVLSETGWLATQETKFREQFLERAVLKNYAKGEFIYHFGDPAGMICGVVDGAVMIGVPHPIAGQYQVHLGLSGDWYGMAAVLFGMKQSVEVQAAMATQMMCVPEPAVNEMLLDLRNYRSLSTAMLWNHEKAIRTTTDLLISNPTARVCARLLTLCGARFGKNPPEKPVELPITQDQLAMMCGLSRKSVNRVLIKLKVDKICEYRYGSLVVPNCERLETKLVQMAARLD
jgi:CRP-like cAMP-binding protein